MEANPNTLILAFWNANMLQRKIGELDGAFIFFSEKELLDSKLIAKGNGSTLFP